MALPARHQFSITYLDRLDIENKRQGLREPSGLALCGDGQALWVVSDDTRRIFQIDLRGHIQPKASFAIDASGLEGITLDASGRHLLAVAEDGNTFLKAEIEARTIVQTAQLAAMAGYEPIAPYFASGPANKGLEGVAWNDSSQTLFALKEGQPGLLIEVTADLQTIVSHRLLDADQGFVDSELDPEAIDFSDLCYDRRRDCLWIISDKARRLFLYDWRCGRVLQSCRLAYGDQGDYREINKAEGLAISAQGDRL